MKVFAAKMLKVRVGKKSVEMGEPKRGTGMKLGFWL